MQQGNLTHAWTKAQASLPQGWKLGGVVKAWIRDQSVGEDTSRDAWVAIAYSEDDWVDAEGEIPEQALNNLAEKLRRAGQ